MAVAVLFITSASSVTAPAIVGSVGDTTTLSAVRSLPRITPHTSHSLACCVRTPHARARARALPH
eukprot:4085462-Prymnesium_polylepis.1